MAGGTRQRLQGLSGTKRVLAGAVAVAAGIVALWGAFKAIDEALNRYSEWREDDTPSQLTVTPSLGLQVWQDDAQNAMFLADEGSDPLVRVPMDARPFQIRVPRQPDDVGIGVGAWPDASILRLQPGESTEATQFGPGKGGAAFVFGGGNLTLTTEANNYFIGDRLESEGDRDAIFVSTFTDPALPEPEQVSPVTDQEEDVYVVVYIDKNSDEIVDVGEYEYMLLDF
jgi:hypothetical protein